MSSYQHDLSLFLMWTNLMPCFCYHCFDVAILWLEVCFKQILSICHFLVNIDIQCLVFVAFSFNSKLDIFIQHSGNRNGLNFHKYKELWALHMNIIRRLTLKFWMTFKNVLAEHCTYQIFEKEKTVTFKLNSLQCLFRKVKKKIELFLKSTYTCP